MSYPQKKESQPELTETEILKVGLTIYSSTNRTLNSRQDCLLIVKAALLILQG